MDDHQPVVAGSTWDADQLDLQYLLNCITAISNKFTQDSEVDFDVWRTCAASLIQAGLEARLRDQSAGSLSSFLLDVYRKIWLASYWHFKRPFSAFEEKHPRPFGLPAAPVLFMEDMEAMLAARPSICLVRQLCRFGSKYLEPKYQPKELLGKQANSTDIPTQGMRALQDKFERQLLLKTAVPETVPESSTAGATTVKKEQKETHVEAVDDETDSEMDALEKSLEESQNHIARASISKRLVDWRMAKLASMLKCDKNPESLLWGSKYCTEYETTLQILRTILVTDTCAYSRIQKLIEKLKATRPKERRWYCVRTVCIEQFSARDAERIQYRTAPDHTNCDTCREPGKKPGCCLQFHSFSRGDEEQKVGFQIFVPSRYS